MGVVFGFLKYFREIFGESIGQISMSVVFGFLKYFREIFGESIGVFVSIYSVLCMQKM
jgi:hypothetical protein